MDKFDLIKGIRKALTEIEVEADVKYPEPSPYKTLLPSFQIIRQDLNLLQIKLHKEAMLNEDPSDRPDTNLPEPATPGVRSSSTNGPSE